MKAFLVFKGLTLALQLAAIVAIRVALLRPGWSDRLLWRAAITLTPFQLVPVLPPGLHRNGPTTMALVGYAAWAVVAWYSSMRPAWRVVITGACLAILVLALAAPIAFAGGPAIEVAGSFICACAIFCLSIALVERFNIDLFRRGDSA
jgi:hypothetical protein